MLEMLFFFYLLPIVAVITILAVAALYKALVNEEEEEEEEEVQDSSSVSNGWDKIEVLLGTIGELFGNRSPFSIVNHEPNLCRLLGV
jgi:hypothetical protein